MSHEKSFENQVILITGAGSGIGEALAKALYQAGAQLILTGRNKEKLDNVIIKNKFDVSHVSIFIADINREQDRNNLVDFCKKFKKQISILINNAGISDFCLFDEQDDEHISKLVITNLLSPMLLTKKLIPLLKKSPHGLIVNIGSTFGSIGYPGFTAYCASKFGLRGFSQSLRRELANTHVKVCYIAPRATKTSINSDQVTKMNLMLGNIMDDPDTVASLALEAMLKRRPETYIGWPEKLFAKINAVLPKLIDNSLLKQLPKIISFAKKRAL